MAGIPYRQTYEYVQNNDDPDDSDYLAIHRTADTFRVESKFNNGWHPDIEPLLDRFTRLRDDLTKLVKAEREWIKLNKERGNCDFSCDQSGATFVCNEYLVKMKKHWNTDRKRMDVTACVENTKTHAKTVHELGCEMTAVDASAAIKLHIAQLNDKGIE